MRIPLEHNLVFKGAASSPAIAGQSLETLAEPLSTKTFGLHLEDVGHGRVVHVTPARQRANPENIHTPIEGYEITVHVNARYTTKESSAPSVRPGSGNGKSQDP